MRHAMLLALTLTGTLLGRAQESQPNRVEIHFFAGYQFWGNFETYGFDGGDFRDDLEIDEGDTYGVMLAFATWRDTLIELSWSHQESQVQFDDFFAPSRPEIDVTLDYYQVGGQYVFGKDRVRPYTAGSLGVTYVDTNGFGDTTRFSLTGGGGVKLYLNPRIAFRLDGRFKGTFFDSSFDLYCDPFGCIGYVDNTSWLFQAEVSAGISIGF